MKLHILQTANSKTKEKYIGCLKPLGQQKSLYISLVNGENSKASIAVAQFVELGVHFVLLSDQKMFMSDVSLFPPSPVSMAKISSSF